MIVDIRYKMYFVYSIYLMKKRAIQLTLLKFFQITIGFQLFTLYSLAAVDNNTKSQAKEWGQAIHQLAFQENKGQMVSEVKHSMDFVLLKAEAPGLTYPFFTLIGVGSTNGHETLTECDGFPITINGNNDRFKIRGKGFKLITLRIYIRWYNKVFEGDVSNDTWLPNNEIPGVYVYFYNLELNKDNKKV